MNWWGSGFIPIIIYGGGISAQIQSFAITTEDDFDILTEASQQLLIEAAP